MCMVFWRVAARTKVPDVKPRIKVISATFLTVLALLISPVTAFAATGSAAGRVGSIGQGQTEPVYSYADAIRESVWVETGLDGDSDGRNDRVAVDIIRPREPSEAGQKVPVIMDASPYYSTLGRGNESQLKTYDDQGRPVQFPLFYDNYFVPRGYATVLVDLAGTSRSDGCIDIGGPSDIGSAKAVVDWLGGRARGFSSRTGGEPVSADWTNGSVGMIGKSWDGTIANGVAATGVRGLKTIVPISAISSWYDYFFHQGAALYDTGPDALADLVESDSAKQHCQAVQEALVTGAPRNGDWTSFWQERDYTAKVHKVRASVFAVQGMQDLNVRTKHFGQWWSGLVSAGVERKVWLSQTGHVDPFDFRRADWVDTLHRWFDHYLMGIDNGVEKEPMGDVERAVDHWTTDRVWPAPGTAPTQLRLTSGDTPGLGVLGLRPAPAGAAESFTDDPRLDEDDWASDVDIATAAKTAFTTGVLTHDLRLSGSGTVTVAASSSTTSAHLSAVLVDLGPATIRNFAARGEGITDLATRSCWGVGAPGDSPCFKDTQANQRAVDYTVFSRGWSDLGHQGSGKHGQRLTPGKVYTQTLQLAATDHVVPAGHRLALIVAGTDRELLEPADTTPTVTVDLAHSFARLPLVDGASQVPLAQPRSARSLAPLHGLDKRVAVGPPVPAGGQPRG